MYLPRVEDFSNNLQFQEGGQTFLICSGWNNFTQAGRCHRKAKYPKIVHLKIMTLFQDFIHCIICFMDYSVCIAPTLITVLISQCVTKMFCHYNYSHMLSFSNSPGLIASFFRKIYVVQLNSKLVHE